ncbi:MAG: insulinase family protein [Alphaproteobacteria bacterium]|nr:insulinase family protein [Alphaproteobacteria bacterium]
MISAVATLLLAAPAQAAEPVQEVVAANGLTAWLIEDHSLPVLTMKLAFRGGGYAHDEPGREGTAALVTALLSEGAGRYDAKAFQQALEAHAIGLSADIDEDDARAALHSLSEHREVAFELLGLALSEPRFDADAIARVKAQMQTERVMRDQKPAYVAATTWSDIAYPNAPYAQDELGSAQSVEAIAKEDLTAYVRHHFTRDSALIAVVGDITAPELKRLMDLHLAGLPPRSSVALPELTRMKVTATGGHVVRRELPQSQIVFGLEGIERKHPDFYAAYLVNYILGGGLNSRLGQEVRVKRGLAYSIGSGLSPMDHGAIWQGNAGTRNEKVPEVLEILHATLTDLHAKGITQEELDTAKRYVTGSFPLSLDTNDGLAGYLITMQNFGLGKDYLDKRNGYFEAVTLADANRVANTLFDPEKLLTVIVGDPPAAAQGEKQ